MAEESSDEERADSKKKGGAGAPPFISITSAQRAAKSKLNEQ
jgi:hypothetical protein